MLNTNDALPRATSDNVHQALKPPESRRGVPWRTPETTDGPLRSLWRVLRHQRGRIAPVRSDGLGPSPRLFRYSLVVIGERRVRVIQHGFSNIDKLTELVSFEAVG